MYMPFSIVRQDISKMKVDAIVNAANSDLKMGGGVSGAIFRAAGEKELQAACDKFAPIGIGEAVITPGFNLPAKFIIHTVGPVYLDWTSLQSEHYLRLAYRNSLKVALENDCESIAFPLISSGIYGYPKEEALKVARSEIQNFLKEDDLDITLVVYDKESFAISSKLLGAVSSYIDEHYVKRHETRRRQSSNIGGSVLFRADMEVASFEEMPAPSVISSSLDRLVGNLDEPFSQMLLKLIDAKNMTDVQVYKRANLDRKLFSKIRSKKGYMPSKRTAIALAFALELTLSETEDFLKRAGYALSHAVKFDVIVEYFITRSRYDVFEINEVLFEYDQPLLGG